MSPILGIYASQISGHLWPASSYESIQTVTVGAGGSSSVTFSSIPSTYAHLQIRYFLKGSAANWNMIQFNGDTGNNYTYHAVYGNGASALAGGLTGLTGWDFNYNNSTTAFQGGVMDILDYSNTNKYKTGRCLHGFDENGSGIIELNSGLWMSTSAINSFTITQVSGSFSQYSTFALYGIKVA